MAFVGYACDKLLGRNPYLERRLQDADDGLVEVDVLGMRMLVDADDEGIARDLIAHHIREPLTTSAYRSELLSLGDTRSDLTVMDIGSNIGYYALHAADVLDASATIHAIEPAPDNVALLQRNVERNGFDNVEIHRGAIGATTGSEELELATKSNKHRIKTSHLSATSEHGAERVDTPVWTATDFVEREGIAPEDIDVVRMDVEGYETEVFKGMDEILRRSSPLLINVELHPGTVTDREKLDSLIDSLSDAGFEIVSVNGGTIRADVDEFESLKSFPADWYELMVKR